MFLQQIINSNLGGSARQIPRKDTAGFGHWPGWNQKLHAKKVTRKPIDK